MSRLTLTADQIAALASPQRTASSVLALTVSGRTQPADFKDVAHIHDGPKEPRVWATCRPSPQGTAPQLRSRGFPPQLVDLWLLVFFFFVLLRTVPLLVKAAALPPLLTRAVQAKP